jgi:dTDP-glucose 4,6-dehydratase
MSLTAFFRRYGFPVVLTRFANFFGPGQQLYRIVPRTILSALCRRRLPLHGGGTSVRAFVHVHDVAEGLLAAAERGEAGEIYHFSPAEFHSIRQVVEVVCDELGVPFSDVAEPAPERPGKDQAYLMNAEKARARLGWEARVGFREGIRDTIRWAREHLEELRAMSWDYAHKP